MHQWVGGRLPYTFDQGLHRVAAQLAAGVLRLAVGAGTETAGAERHDLNARVASDLQPRMRTT